VAVQPFVAVTVTVNVVVVVKFVTLIDAEVAELLHAYVPPPDAVKVVLPPGQIELLPVILALAVFTVTTLFAVLEQLFTDAVTVYVVVVDGVTFIEAVVPKLFDHKNVAVPTGDVTCAVNVTLVPGHTVIGPAGEIATTGSELTVTLLTAVAVHPFVPVTVTV
jgi:hypothetical protein